MAGEAPTGVEQHQEWLRTVRAEWVRRTSDDRSAATSPARLVRSQSTGSSEAEAEAEAEAGGESLDLILGAGDDDGISARFDDSDDGGLSDMAPVYRCLPQRRYRHSLSGVASSVNREWLAESKPPVRARLPPLRAPDRLIWCWVPRRCCDGRRRARSAWGRWGRGRAYRRAARDGRCRP